MDAVLTVRSAEKRFGATRALAGAELDLTRGQCLGLLGPNGAGKTTLVRAIAGRVRLDAGRITLLDADLTRGGAPARRARHHLGVVPQEIALYDLLTAPENLAAFGRFHGVTGRTLRMRVDWALDWTGLGDRTGSRVSTFSGGMKRRLNIACGVLHQPDVVLLDEPTVGVDPHSRARIWEMLDALRQDGTSLLLTTHQLDEAQKVCDRIAVFDRGRAVAAGTLDALIARTVGSRRTVTLTLAEEPTAAAAGALATAAAQDALHQDFHLQESTLRYSTDDVAASLAALLGQARAQDVGVCDVQVTSPSLHDVFIHLTGRELRE